jgi:hypothetical protein
MNQPRASRPHSATADVAASSPPVHLASSIDAVDSPSPTAQFAQVCLLSAPPILFPIATTSLQPCPSGVATIPLSGRGGKGAATSVRASSARAAQAPEGPSDRDNTSEQRAAAEAAATASIVGTAASADACDPPVAAAHSSPLLPSTGRGRSHIRGNFTRGKV